MRIVKNNICVVLLVIKRNVIQKLIMNRKCVKNKFFVIVLCNKKYICVKGNFFVC